jgi:hypothetical protein
MGSQLLFRSCTFRRCSWILREAAEVDLAAAVAAGSIAVEERGRESATTTWREHHHGGLGRSPVGLARGSVESSIHRDGLEGGYAG